MGRASSLSTKKRFRQSKKRQARNKANKTRLRTELKKVRMSAAAGQDAEKILPEAYSIIDKSVRKGVLSKNAAARHKSRLTKLANKTV
jgi:small subunit ribosomal protein S20